MVPDGFNGKTRMDSVELHIQLGPQEVASVEPPARLANDNAEREQDLFEQSVQREATDDEV